MRAAPATTVRAAWRLGRRARRVDRAKMTTPTEASPRRPIGAAVKFHATRLAGKLASRLGRTIARRRKGELAPGRFSVLIVNWNTLDYLRPVLDAVAKFSPPDTEIVVVDNASTDGSRAFLKRAGVRWLRSPINLGHGPAMDLATTMVRTEYFATLDVDAFPISAEWLGVMRGHLDAGSAVVGGRLYRKFAHPSMLAMATRTFRERDHTFIRSAWVSSADFVHGESWDVGELISMREAPNITLIEASEVRGPDVIGMVYGGLVYHNGASSHGPAEYRAESRIAWKEAQARFLSDDS